MVLSNGSEKETVFFREGRMASIENNDRKDQSNPKADKIDPIQKWKNAAENVKLAASQPISHSLGFPLSVSRL